jgi:hypothetical protein
VNVNELGQPIGDLVPDWVHRPYPATSMLIGDYCRLQRLDADRHGDETDAGFWQPPKRATHSSTRSSTRTRERSGRPPDVPWGC